MSLDLRKPQEDIDATEKELPLQLVSPAIIDPYYLYQPEDCLIRHTDNAERNMCFHDNDGNIVGKFVFTQGELQFTGNPNESAKIFIDWAKQLWSELFREGTDAR